MTCNNLKAVTIGSISALAMAAAGSASAVEFEVVDTTVNIGGYLKADGIYSVDEDLGDTLNTRAINVGDAEDDEVDGKTRMHARQSRVWISTSSPTSTGGDLKTYWEGDFFGAGGNETFSNSSSFRIRHAYGEWNGLLAGQTWSNFMFFNAYPTTVDFAGPAGVSFVRQGQVRYTVPTGAGKFSIALENPESTIIDASVTGDVDPTNGAAELGDFAGAAANDPLPDLTAALHGQAGAFDWRVSGLLRNIEVDNGSDSDSTTGWGASGSAAWTLGGTTLQAGVIYGDGIGRYVYEGLEMEAFYDGSDIETIKQLGTVVAVSQKLTPRLTGGLAWGHSDADVDDLVRELQSNGVADADTVQETVDTVHATLLYTPVKRVTYGLEWQYAQRETQGGDDGDANRFQVSAQYNF